MTEPRRTLVDLLEGAEARYGDRTALSIRRDDGSVDAWSYRELARRSRLAAWRLRSRGLRPGDRLLTWSTSCPELAAVYFGAMRAGLIIVPLDLRMAPATVRRIADRSGASQLAIGTGRDAPDPAEADLDRLPTATIDDLCAEPGAGFPAGWDADVAAWPRPAPEDPYLLVFTSGTTGTPKGVVLAHENTIAGVDGFHRIVPDMEYRVTSVLPLAHLFEQAIGLYLTLDLGADILYVRTRNPRVVFESIRDHRTTAMILVPQILEVFWSALLREVERRGRTASFERSRRIARRLPMAARRLIFRQIHRQLGGRLRLLVSAGAFLPPAVQQGWEDIGVIVMQGYGATETGSGACTTWRDHPLGTVGRPVPGMEMRIAEDGEVLFRGPSVTRGYWEDPAATAAVFTADGFYRSGDLGRLDSRGRLVLHGRKRDIIVLPNGLNVFPEDIENALRVAGIRDSIVLETEPGRIEAIILAPVAAQNAPDERLGAQPTGAFEEPDAIERFRADVDAAVKAANATLAVHARVAAWRFWPDTDFPRTLTLKVRRDQVRAWAAVSAPLPVTDGA
ncbi:MAG: AMP-binding protein [Candidatus Limnocylindrales bacterium]|nr:AMP-binding protein [Candidatus Limnocylindrales bacterium]